MKEIPQPPAPQEEVEKYQSMIGQPPPAEAKFWGRVGRPDYYADVYKLDDVTIYANGWTKIVYEVRKNDGTRLR